MFRKQALLLALLFVASFANQVEDDIDDVSIEDAPSSIDVPYSSPPRPPTAHFAEHFDDPNGVDLVWTKSQAAKYDGEWKVEAAAKDALEGDLGLVLKSKAKHAAISAKLGRPFVFGTKPLVVQYEVALQEGQECGGAYLKLLSGADDDPKAFHDKTPYAIMFGPDKCGNDHKLHFIFRHRNPRNHSLEEKHCRKPKERLDDYYKDKLPHLYTLVVNPDNTYDVRIDRKSLISGSLLEDFTPSVNPPREIDDPADSKPENWDEREKIPDPEARKPDDWDEDAPAEIPNADAEKPEGWLEDEEMTVPDAEAVQPDDWDADMDGEWEAPLVDNPRCKDAVGCGKWQPPKVPNPEYRGKWRPPYVDNPSYKGKWTPRRIPNPDYYEDKHPFQMQTIFAVGFELWSMTDNIYFDNVLITDDLKVAEKWAENTFDLKRKKIAKDSESFVQRMLVYTEEYPWLWVVYVLVLGLPIVLIVFCCCKSTPEPQVPEEKEEKEYDAATVKKTDAETKDDKPVPLTKEHLEKEVSSDEEGKPLPDQDKEVVTEKELEESDDNDNVMQDAQGDAPRKRRVRKD